MNTLYSQTLSIPGTQDRMVAIATFVLMSAATLLMAITAAWPLRLVEACLCLLLLAYLQWGSSACVSPRSRLPLGGLVMVTGWGFLQWVTNHTAYREATLTSVLQWCAVLAAFVLCARLMSMSVVREAWLTAMVGLGTLLAVLEIADAAAPSGNLLWIFPTSYQRLHGPFQYYNNFAAMIELVLPVALYRAILMRSQMYALAGGILYTSIIVSGSRTGAILATSEVLAVTAALLIRIPGLWRELGKRLVLTGAAATITLPFAWTELAKRFEQEHPLTERISLNQSSLEMFRERPATGFGLGTYAAVYPAYARFDNGRYVNYAHNDWAEWAVEGGWPFLFGVLTVVLPAIGPSLRSVWGIGFTAVSLHGLVDYPFRRFGLEVWIFALLAAVLAERIRHAGPCTSVIEPRNTITT